MQIFASILLRDLTYFFRLLFAFRVGVGWVQKREKMLLFSVFVETVRTMAGLIFLTKVTSVTEVSWHKHLPAIFSTWTLRLAV